MMTNDTINFNNPSAKEFINENIDNFNITVGDNDTVIINIDNKKCNMTIESQERKIKEGLLSHLIFNLLDKRDSDFITNMLTRPSKEYHFPTGVMSHILSYLPKPVIKPEPYGILNYCTEGHDRKPNGFGIILKVTPKFIWYSVWKPLNNEEDEPIAYYMNGTYRKKIRKDKENRFYYVLDEPYNPFYTKKILKIDNKLPVTTCFNYNRETGRFTTTTDHLTEYKLKRWIYTRLPSINSYPWDISRDINDELPIIINN